MHLNEAYATNDTSKLPALANHCYELSTRLDQLLLMYKFQGNRYQPYLDYCSLEDLVNDSILECQPILDSRRVRLALDFGDAQEQLIRVDPQLFFILLNNLIYNAAIWAKAQVSIRISKLNHAVKLEVHDDGDGFPDFMFDVDFSQLHHNQDPKLLTKLGTGLYLCAFAAGALSESGIPCHIALKNDAGAAISVTLENQP
jgi:K+-sensing histidine kinase KdpD